MHAFAKASSPRIDFGRSLFTMRNRAQITNDTIIRPYHRELDQPINPTIPTSHLPATSKARYTTRRGCISGRVSLRFLVARGVCYHLAREIAVQQGTTYLVKFVSVASKRNFYRGENFISANPSAVKFPSNIQRARGGVEGQRRDVT